MQGVRNFLRTGAGRFVAIGICVVGVGVFLWVLWGFIGRSEAEAFSQDRVFICSKTGKTFKHTLKVGESIPIKSPHSGENTGYEAEKCYWNADGSAKKEPTYVLVARKVDPNAGETFCPDCGRRVVELNPVPGEGIRPPPTKEEWDRRQGGRRQSADERNNE